MEANLNDLAKSIKTAHAKVTKALQAGLQHAKDAGEKLAIVSSSRPAKEFVQWVKTEIGISERTAYNYIKIHKNWLEVQGEDNYVSALKALRKSRKPKADVPAQVLTPDPQRYLPWNLTAQQREHLSVATPKPPDGEPLNTGRTPARNDVPYLHPLSALPDPTAQLPIIYARKIAKRIAKSVRRMVRKIVAKTSATMLAFLANSGFI